MRTVRQFEFQASFFNLDEGLDVLHRSVDGLRRALGRRGDDRDLMLFETALAEIGSNVLTHGRPVGTSLPIEYALHLDGNTIAASLTDSGPAVHEHLARSMPDADSEGGRGIALARELLDELGYERDGDRNRWRLVKRL
jgi:serine/threonine-protein kinase RsbW